MTREPNLRDGEWVGNTSNLPYGSFERKLRGEFKEKGDDVEKPLTIEQADKLSQVPFKLEEPKKIRTSWKGATPVHWQEQRILLDGECVGNIIHIIENGDIVFVAGGVGENVYKITGRARSKTIYYTKALYRLAKGLGLV
jgi:hypothetical protein